VISMRRAQLSFGDGLIAVEVEDLLEEWMKHAEEVLNDEQLVATVFEALAKRRPKSRSRGRSATPAEVVLRLLILRRVRNWCQSASNRDPRFASKRDPFERRVRPVAFAPSELVGVAETARARVVW
jgi:transposase, IS5 family